MRNEEVIAYSGKGDDKKEVARETIQLVDTVAEAVKVHGEEGVVKLVNQAYKTNKRNSLARPAGQGKLKAAYAVYKKCLESGVKGDQALTISGLSKEQVAELGG